MKNTSEMVVVITGATSGIGRATALAFAAQKAIVVLAARRKEALDNLVKKCENLGGKALAIPTDITKETQVNALVHKTIEHYGKIDVWVNNAAVGLFGRIEETPVEDIKRTIDVNLFGYIYGARSVIPYFRSQGKGTLINVSSMVGITGQPFSTAYALSKAAILGLSYSLEQELADEKDIHVCAVLPAVVDTPLFNQAANYMGYAIKPPEPVIPAKKVAKAIVKLSKKPKKEITVGGMAKVSRLGRWLMPKKFDKQFRKKILNDHFQDKQEAPTPGNLYEPMPQYASTSGGWSGKLHHLGSAIAKAVITGTAIAGVIIGGSMLLKEKKDG
jgi:short-subunit dehydrogenase